MTWKILESNPNIKMCPKCNTLIELDGGCSSVVCRNCMNMVKLDKSKIVLSPRAAIILLLIEVFCLIPVIWALTLAIDQKDWPMIALIGIVGLMEMCIIAFQIIHSDYVAAFLVYVKTH